VENRLPQQPGEWIDRNQPVNFQFEGTTYTGYAGDVLASALWANNIRFTARSFKYHRPRGIYSLANHDANFLVDDGSRTNLRGDQLLIHEGLVARAVNTWGGLQRDRLKVTQRFGKLMPVGFYYKAFHTPRKLFPFFENQMRQVAGLGSLHPDYVAKTTPKDYAFCDLLVIGAGPAGLSAALAAADEGVDVLLVDELPHAGGSLTWQLAGDPDACKLLKSLLERVHQHDRIRLRLGTQAAGWYSDHWIALVDEQRLTKLRAKALVVASGCYEQPAVFQNNDLPGILLGSAAQRLLYHYAVRPFRSAVVMTANSDGYRLALDLLEAGVEVPAVVDLRANSETELADRVARKGIEIHHQQAIFEAIPTKAKQAVAGVRIAPLESTGKLNAVNPTSIPCDGVAVSVGWAPTADILYQAGGRFSYDQALEQLVPTSLPSTVHVAGRIRGIFHWQDQVEDGHSSGLAACRSLGHNQDQASAPIEPKGPAPSHPYPIFPHPGKKNFVDFDEDLHLDDFIHAHQEGYDNIELMKRYSTVGMGPSQGKLSNQNAIRILARLNENTIDQTGTTTSRPFHHPVSIEHLAGRRFHPARRTPMHDWHRDHGGQFIYVGGGWERPEFYAQAEKPRGDCILDEAHHVRQHVGMIDLGTLGKIVVSGPDAAAFLNRIYIGSFTKQKPGTLRYGVACDESGVIIDDGVVARLAEEHFYLSATSSGGASFYRELQRWALLWGMRVVLVNLAGQYTAMNLAGPRSRDVLSSLTDIDLTPGGFPFSAARQGQLAGVSAIVMRVGFIGELGYEIHVPAHHGCHVWNAIMHTGEAHSIRPFGVEAQRLLRLEKGHLIVGQDTDALTTPNHANLAGLIRRQKKFFVGQRSLKIHDNHPLDRKLVGFCYPPNTELPLPDECNLIIADGQIAGRVTSIAHRSTLGHPLGLAHVRPDLAETGTTITIRTDSGALSHCQIADTPFYDPEGERQLIP
jgi:sarcosine oxidase subunit alpha